MGRVRVKQSHPEFAFDLLNLTKQRNERRSASRIDRLSRSDFGVPQIHSVVRGVLTDQVDFAHTFTDQGTDLRQHRLRFAAPMLAAHLWDHAKTARMITALGNFHVGRMRRSKSETWCAVVRNVCGPLIREYKIKIVASGMNVERPTPNAQRRTASIQRWALGAGCWT